MQDQDEGLKILVESRHIFTYLGNRCVAITSKQIKLLDEKKVVYEILSNGTDKK